MEKNKNKIREPYHPEDTPKPPQIIDPDEGRGKKPVKDKPSNQQHTGTDGKDKKRDPLLGDPTEIDDETTI